LNPLITPLPASRDPFVNTFLRYAGTDPETGEARYWFSTWNYNSGCLAVLVTESGGCKTFRFDPDKEEFGFYGTAYAGNNKMWLCGYTSKLLCLDLETGEIERYETGLEKSLAFSGFIYDETTRTILGGSYSQKSLTFIAFCFDVDTRTILKTFSENVTDRGNYFTVHYPNGDGTYTLAFNSPNYAFMRWNPRALEFEPLGGIIYPEKENPELQVSTIMRDGKIYVSTKGWFDPETGLSDITGMPSAEAMWFCARGNKIYGTRNTYFGNSELYCWDTETNKAERILEIPDAQYIHFALAESGIMLCINIYGFFYRIDPEAKTILSSKRLPTDSIASMDCLEKISDDRILLTPFITQRFCEVDLKTGQTSDMGKAAMRGGEVLVAITLDGLIYMSVYTTGQLVEYDPSIRPFFPENPRIVVQPPSNAMRPITVCKDEKSIYYVCSNHYGTLGSIAIKHTPSTGETIFCQDPIGDFIIQSLFYDQGRIFAGSDIHADCRSYPPKESAAVLAELDPVTLGCVRKIELPVKGNLAEIIGQVDSDTYLFAVCHDGEKADFGFFSSSSGFAEMGNSKALRVQQIVEDANSAQREREIIRAAGEIGKFVVAGKDMIQIWDFDLMRKVNEFPVKPGFRDYFVNGGDLFLLYRKEMAVYRRFLAESF
jgi:hypothetical protein